MKDCRTCQALRLDNTRTPAVRICRHAMDTRHDPFNCWYIPIDAGVHKCQDCQEEVFFVPDDGRQYTRLTGALHYLTCKNKYGRARQIGRQGFISTVKRINALFDQQERENAKRGPA